MRLGSVVTYWDQCERGEMSGGQPDIGTQSALGQGAVHVKPDGGGEHGRELSVPVEEDVASMG